MKKMEKEFLPGEPPKPAEKINVYTCPLGHKMVTIDLEEGTTPMLLACRTCGQTARSAWYMCDQTLTPEFEWYRPLPTDKLSREERDHCKQGGLLIRRIGGEKATPPDAKDGTTVGRNEPCPCGAMTTGDNPRRKKFKECHINDPAGLALIILSKEQQQ